MTIIQKHNSLGQVVRLKRIYENGIKRRKTLAFKTFTRYQNIMKNPCNIPNTLGV